MQFYKLGKGWNLWWIQWRNQKDLGQYIQKIIKATTDKSTLYHIFVSYISGQWPLVQHAKAQVGGGNGEKKGEREGRRERG